MHLIKPVWLCHRGEFKDFEVYSCHVSPDGKRLVTAGGDGCVRVWSTEAILKSAQTSFDGPTLLATLSNHSGTIHAARFSNNNKYLASGADDKIVCIYAIDSNPPACTSKIGASEVLQVENWRVLRRLFGHDNDVQDLGWSSDSSILVSVGLDSRVVVWSGYSFEKLKTLTHHQSHVKGIAFDPANRFFATASDDRTLKIYKFTSPGPNATAANQSNNFILEKSISTPFLSSPLTTYFRRCSWSPDGNHIAAANAVNGPVSSVAIINRNGWNSEINLIGHEGPVEICAFSPQLFHKSQSTSTKCNPEERLQSLKVIACAGQDKSLSIWSTSLSRPFVIAQELSSKSISDLAWAPDGETLYLCTLDGVILVLAFEEGELGCVASSIENEKSLSKFALSHKRHLYEHHKELSVSNDISSDGATLLHTTTKSLIEPTNELMVNKAVGNSEDLSLQSHVTRSCDKIRNRVSYTEDGRKKITPVLI